jgi:hypothetical protein
VPDVGRAQLRHNGRAAALEAARVRADEATSKINFERITIAKTLRVGDNFSRYGSESFQIGCKIM